MLVPIFVAALAAIPAISAQDVMSVMAVTAATTGCETRSGLYEYTKAGGLPTYTTYASMVLTNTYQVTTTTRATITVTPSALTATDTEIVTATTTTTVTSVPAATTIAAPANWFPIYNPELAQPTAMARIKRGSLEARAAHNVNLLKRQTNPDNTAGYIVDRNGTSRNLNQTYPYRVVCTVQTVVDLTETTIVTGAPDIITILPATATAEVTTTVSVTDTVTQVMPTPTVHAACLSNNVVNHIRGVENEDIYFDRIIWRANGGLPIANSLVATTSTGTECCVLCHDTPSCAGSFFVPSEGKCHLRLNKPALPIPSSISPPYPMSTGSASNASSLLPTASGLRLRRAISTGTAVSDSVMATPISESESMMMTLLSAPLSTVTPVADTCPLGSMSEFLGTAYGSESFPEDLAIVFSNGPCGHIALWMIPVEYYNTNDPTTPGQFKRI